MSQPVGNLCIVLHGHLPYVLHHGSYPHGEAWLFEAAAETYLPLLDMIGGVALMGKRPALTIGLTPVLLEQLAHPRFKAGFMEYLDGRIEKAEADKAEFAKNGEKHNEYLAPTSGSSGTGRRRSSSSGSGGTSPASSPSGWARGTSRF